MEQICHKTRTSIKNTSCHSHTFQHDPLVNLQLVRLPQRVQETIIEFFSL